eukprot:snap_masked-scaffold_8-processed-gene-12.35-mRNA-1 protein AED:1.00 eAED:1.00 QI:0/-1/0/0/-1/1/1/0/610
MSRLVQTRKGIEKKLLISLVGIVASLYLLGNVAYNLAEKSYPYHFIPGIKYLREANPNFAFSLFFGKIPKGKGYRDNLEKQWKIWSDSFSIMVPSVFGIVVVCYFLDQVFSRTMSKTNALRSRLIVTNLLGIFILWKLYFVGIVAFFLLAVSGLVFLHLAKIFILSQQTKGRKIIALLFIWFSIGLSCYFSTITFQKQIDMFLSYFSLYIKRQRKQLVRTMPYAKRIINFFMSSAGLDWSGLARFYFFRVIDFSTFWIFNENPELDTYNNLWFYLYYVFYPPLVYQGPICSFGSFLDQHTQRYPVRSRHWMRNFQDIISVAFFVVLKEVIDHNWFLGMFLKRENALSKLQPEEIIFALVAKLFQHYLRFVIFWRFFRIWASLDGVEAPENFTRQLFTMFNAADFWHHFNRSVHLWCKRNIATPIAQLSSFGRRIKTLTIYLCVFLVMIFWHGGSPAWIYWGVSNAMFLILEKAILSSWLIYRIDTVSESQLEKFQRWNVLLLNSVYYGFLLLHQLAVWDNIGRKKEDQWVFGETRNMLSNVFWNRNAEYGRKVLKEHEPVFINLWIQHREVLTVVGYLFIVYVLFSVVSLARIRIEIIKRIEKDQNKKDK